MHPKNPFIKDYNFEDLVANHPPLKPFVSINEHCNKTINFGNHEAVKALNTALLKEHFGISYWNIPDNNLCPPVPGRLDYLLHVADLLPKKDIHLLDIGTGANLIYPILATRHFNWKCTATEVNLDSLRNAQEIIDKNTDLKDIKLRHQQFKSTILVNIIKPTDYFDVVVCNPPFFKNSTDAEKNNLRKFKNLKLDEESTKNFGGLSNELWYKGGEEGFIKKMAEESVPFKNQVQWFTAIVSQKDNLKNIKRAINKTKPAEVKIVEMEQGNKQSRFIAWTFRA
ncbi:23S rRNA (adenine(1618)-N(6))-methyltransferase RlmF [Aequorivita viscosa]|uniref:23S rRNA (Adenine1618-N6)-methyltransferase n=1 Tax=Aequorivita viscosa TaxID=797419 RepID=A0A1M6NC91_9FLAO|nr:23S rRNA (adenine(1618)-N(6))-methyltransferase RlmF [Aequorivita viscosa]SDX45781.1 23S rRNA m(6)A-1618 methyltransferase [Aequorivita viscosa]SHJ93196.1 23S rRNA (adenine1618-N6)-methyltransferase [Aequorivita viscosa]